MDRGRRQHLPPSVMGVLSGMASHMTSEMQLDNMHREEGEDYMAELAEEIAHSPTLQLHSMQEELNVVEERWANGCWSDSSCKPRADAACRGAQQVFLSTSPQSTLAAATSWDLHSPGISSNGGMSSGVSSPPAPVEQASNLGTKDKEDSLDLLYAELLRLKMEDEIKVRQLQLAQLKQQQQQQYQKFLWRMRQLKESPFANKSFEELKTAQSMADISPTRISSQVTVSASYRGKLKGNDLSLQNQERQQLNGFGGGSYAPPHKYVCSKPTGSWPALERSTLQHHAGLGTYNGAGGSSRYSSFKGARSQQSNANALSANGSGMRAVFLGLPGARESAGTGVFLPRRAGAGGCHQAKRKPACSTVLLPSRVVQALNLNVADTLAPHPHPPAFPAARGDVSAPRLRSAASCSLTVESTAAGGRDHQQQQLNMAWPGGRVAACSALQEVAPDVCLPTEWTY